MSLTQYKVFDWIIARQQQKDVEKRAAVTGGILVEVMKADEVRAVLAAYIQHGERLLADVIGTSESAESFRYWIEKLKQEIAND